MSTHMVENSVFLQMEKDKDKTSNLEHYLILVMQINTSTSN
jgi:hypothetical protein